MNKCRLKQILLLLLVMLPGVNVRGENNDNIKTIVIDASKLISPDEKKEKKTQWNDGGFWGYCMTRDKKDGLVSLNGIKTQLAYVYNTTAIPGRIKSIKIKRANGTSINCTIYLGNKQYNESDAKGKAYTSVSLSTTDEVTIDVKQGDNFHYFYLNREYTGNYIGFSYFKIEYEAAVTTPTIDAEDCATFSSPLMLDLSNLEGVEAYIATGCNSEKVTMEKVTTTIPENTGVVLKSTSNEAKAFTIPTAAIASELNNNLLIATTEEIEVKKANNGTNWVLAGSGSSLGWYYIANYTATLAAGKCYMHTEGTNPAKSSIEMSFENNATSMDIVNYGANESCAVYNLAGQRVDNNAKGLVIINGKKVYKK